MEGILAHGGSSRVWAIVSPDGTPLAFKELTLQDAGAEKVFLRETAVLRHLRHPAIVPIQDVLMTETHTGVVLPRALGSLADWVERKGPMPPRLATRCILTALSGLQYAHEEGILHRDLKPGISWSFPTNRCSSATLEPPWTWIHLKRPPAQEWCWAPFPTSLRKDDGEEMPPSPPTSMGWAQPSLIS